MNRYSRVIRGLLTGCVLLISASGQVAKADPAGTPSDHAEWLDRLLAADITHGPTEFDVISAGGYHNCGLASDQTVGCWGYNAYGLAVVPDGVYTSVSAGLNHNCGLKTDQEVACWGSDASGQASPPSGSFLEVSSGAAHTCGLSTDQTISCWGNNTDGQATPPVGLYNSVSADGYHTCGLETDQTITCWGFNYYGESTAPPGSYTQVDAGAYHSCGLETDQTIHCWGNNSNGEASAPDGFFTEVSSGGSHTCGLRTNQTITCWGRNEFGQSDAPQGRFTDVSAGQHHTCAIRSDDRTVCWGDNQYRQLAIPATPASISDPGVEQYVTDLEIQRDLATFFLAIRTGERDRATTAPVCELKAPSAAGSNARASMNKDITGTVRWTSAATKASLRVQVRRSTATGFKYWVSGTTWSSTPTTKTVKAGATYAGTTEAPWKLVFAVPAGIGNTYSVSCWATDTLGNESPTPDEGKLISIA